MKYTKLLKILPVIFAVIMLFTMSAMVLSLKNERKILEQKELMNDLGNELEKVSDNLTINARWYVQSGEEEYLSIYMNETQVLKTREKIRSALEESGAPQNEIDLLASAVMMSFEIENYELESFSELEKGNTEHAQTMLFSTEYRDKKQPIKNTIVLYREAVEKRCNKQVANALARSNISFALTVISTAFVIFFINAGSKSLNRKISGMNDMVQNTVKLAKGEFDIDFYKYKSNDEFGCLATGLQDILTSAESIAEEIYRLTADASLAKLSIVDNSGIKGKWSDIMRELKNAVGTVRAEVIESAPIAYITVSDDRVTDCNLYAKQRLGILPGVHMVNYYKDVAHRESIIKRLETGETVENELIIFRTATGEFLRFSVHINTLYNTNGKTTVIWGMDVNTDELKNDIIRRSQADLKLLIDNLPVAMVIENPTDNIVEYANAACSRLFENSFESESGEFSGSICCNPIQSDNIPAEEKQKNLLNSMENPGTIFNGDFTFLTNNGKIIEARVTASEIFYNGKKCIVKVIQDIGDELLRNQLIERAAKREREANTLQSIFLSNISHEIRTPMNSIIGLSELALMDNSKSKNTAILRKINSSSKNLMNIITDLLEFSIIEAENSGLVEDEFSIEDIVSGAFLAASEYIGSKHIEMLLDMPPELPAKISGDKARLWRILKAILENSAKYTEEGCIILEVFTAKQTCHDLHLTFQITDTGIGMSEEQVGRLFDPFTQFSEKYKYKSSGTGLGMSIVKRLLELMNGTIEVESEMGIGTRISVNINFKHASDRATIGESFAPRLNADASVLIVDDSELSCEINQRILKSAGFSPECIYSGSQAVTLVKQRADSGSPFKAIILGYILGQENGVDIAQKISKISPESKLIMVSAYSKAIPENDIRDAGFVDVLQKPIVPTDFVKRVSDALSEDGSLLGSRMYTFSGANILLCEDNRLNQEVTTEMLKLIGINADIAENGSECLKMLMNKDYDLILMDILMPVMDGKTATERIRNSDMPFKNIVIVALTANALPAQVKELIECGMNDHIAKPVDFNELYIKFLKHLPESKRVPAEPGFTGFPLKNDGELNVRGINTDDGLARFAGNKERYTKALLRFASEYTEIPENDGSDDFKRYVHTIKGVAGNLGIYSVSSLAAELEKDLESNDKFRLLAAELMDIKDIINADVIAMENTAVVTENGSKDEYLTCISAIKEAAEQYNPTECEILIKKLRKTSWEGVTLPNLMSLAKAAEDYDFDTVISIVNELAVSS